MSHHKRSSWLSPFKAGWGTLRVITTYLIDRLFVVPGTIILILSALLNLAEFLFPATFINTFHAGILSQSIFMFISSIGAFGLCTGLLARFAYRRQQSSLKILASGPLSRTLFSSLVGATLLEILLTALVISNWIRGLSLPPEKITYVHSLLSGWLSFTSLYLCILSVSVASLIGNHAQKFRQ